MCLCQILVLLRTCFAMSTKMVANCKPPITTASAERLLPIAIDTSLSRKWALKVELIFV